MIKTGRRAPSPKKSGFKKPKSRETRHHIVEILPSDLYQKKRSCWRKKNFDSAKQARAHNKKLRKIYPDAQVQYPYYCTVCGKVHLTHIINGKGATI